MGYYSSDPIRYLGVSNVVSSLESKYPELGTRFVEDGREYVFVYNGGESDINPGYGAVIQTAATNMSVTVSAVTSADIVVGVCRNATLTTGTYGFLVTRGVTPVEMGATSGSVAARGLIEIGANGVFVPVSNTSGHKAPPIGIALSDTVSSASGEAYICCY